jgi:hypothetical protein
LKGKNKNIRFYEQIQYPLAIYSRNGNQLLQLSFDEIKSITGVAIDYSFLNYKKELMDYGYEVGKISLKENSRFQQNNKTK